MLLPVVTRRYTPIQDKVYSSEMSEYATCAEMDMSRGASYAHYYKQNIADTPAANTAKSKIKRLVQVTAAVAAGGTAVMT